MKRLLILLAIALPGFAQQAFDFKLLDRVGANASNSTNITLDAGMLKVAGQFLGSGKGGDDLKGLIGKLKSVTVRNWEFDGKGKYDEADLAPIRAWLAMPEWHKIVDVKEKTDSTTVYLKPLPDDQLGGVAIVSVEPKEVTVVYIEGTMKMEDLGKLGGNMGIPDMSILNGAKPAKKE